MNVSAIIVTRGDVDVMPCFETIPEHWQKLVWVNGDRLESWGPQGYMQDAGVLELGGGGVVFPDLSVYGRYAAIEHTSADLIFCQDDDVIVSDPQAIVDTWKAAYREASIGKWGMINLHTDTRGFLVANMPQEFRHDGYTDSCLVGFGACFHRDAPARAFAKWQAAYRPDASQGVRQWTDEPSFNRTADVIFTCLTPRVLVDVPKVNRGFAEDEGRMYRQPGHVEERARMLELARQVRDS